MAERYVQVASKVGLHARPATQFVTTAAQAPMPVTVAKPQGAPVNAKSILAVLGLDARHGETIVLAADGDGAEVVLESLATVVTASDD